jgi:hypothetical protein
MERIRQRQRFGKSVDNAICRVAHHTDATRRFWIRSTGIVAAVAKKRCKKARSAGGRSSLHRL